MSDPLHPHNVDLPPGCVYPMACCAGDGDEGEAIPAHVPEAEAAARSAAQMILGRVTAGRRTYGKGNVTASAERLLRLALEEVADTWAYLDWARVRQAPVEGRLRVYIAGPYSAATNALQQANIDIAREAMLQVLRRGHDPFCPHTHSAWCDKTAPDITWDRWLELDLSWLSQAHALLLLPGWEESRGSRIEREAALELGLLIVEDVDALPRPEEVRESWPP